MVRSKEVPLFLTWYIVFDEWDREVVLSHLPFIKKRPQESNEMS